MAAAWIADAQLSMRHQGSGKWTDEQLFASYALARLKGGYHHLGKIKPNGHTGVETNIYGSMSTYDFKDLTEAVLIAHEMGVRIDIKSSGPRMLKVYAHTRVSSDDSQAFFVSERHPTIHGLIQRARAYNPGTDNKGTDTLGEVLELIERVACHYPNQQECPAHNMRDPLLEASAKLQSLLARP